MTVVLFPLEQSEALTHFSYGFQGLNEALQFSLISDSTSHIFLLSLHDSLLNVQSVLNVIPCV